MSLCETQIVVITTSGIGERLKHFTQKTNKSLIKIGDKFAICYIIEKYDIKTEFVITLGYCGNYVKDFLLLAYPDRNFTFVNVDNYVGAGSSLGYSLLCAEKYLQRPFFFHCCDTIISDIPQHSLTKNTLFVYKHTDATQYSTICCNAACGEVSKINKKGCSMFDFAYIGLSFIADYSLFWKYLNILYSHNRNNNNLSDVDVYQYMAETSSVSFEYIETKEWYDVGNLESFQKTRDNFPAKYYVLEKPNESICFVERGVIKFIDNENINQKRYIRGTQLYPLSPQIIEKRDNFILMETIEGVVLSEIKTPTMIYDLLTWAQKYLWINQKINPTYCENCRNFYIKKTLDRIQHIDENAAKINGVIIPPVKELITIVEESKILETDTFAQFHGDFILDNIIFSDAVAAAAQYKLVDWRHEFDVNMIDVGDIYYDLAKLKHNMIINHKNVLNGLYDFTISGDEIVVDIKTNYSFVHQFEDYNRFIKEYGYNMTKINIITALIWLNMSPLYSGKFQQFLFYFGKYHLARALKDI